MINITKRLMLDFMHARINQDRVSAATVNREAALVKSMLFRAVEWDIIGYNPLQGLKLLPEAVKRQVNLSLEQAAQLLDEITDPTIADIVEFAIYSGFRKENILSLKIETLHFHDITPTGEVELLVKSGRKEVFPLSTIALIVLKRNIRNRKRGYVFINPQTENRYSSIHKGFNRAVCKLGLTVNGTKFRFHDLRHVFATWLHRGGISLDVVRPLLGHQDVGTTDRYVSYDRMAYAKALNVIPHIQRGAKKRGA